MPSLVVGSIFLVFIVVVIAAAIGAYFEMRAWRAMYEITGTKSFDDAANWFKWGAITAIVIIGFLLMFIARIFVILGFSNMPEELEEKPQAEAKPAEKPAEEPKPAEAEPTAEAAEQSAEAETAEASEASAEGSEAETKEETAKAAEETESKEQS
jgi:flagellar biosynthesis/type III secretory pathway M-ring protein FliF/YscJ